jgi:hypothetical protein
MSWELLALWMMLAVQCTMPIVSGLAEAGVKPRPSGSEPGEFPTWKYIYIYYSECALSMIAVHNIGFSSLEILAFILSCPRVWLTYTAPPS